MRVQNKITAVYAIVNSNSLLTKYTSPTCNDLFPCIKFMITFSSLILHFFFVFLSWLNLFLQLSLKIKNLTLVPLHTDCDSFVSVSFFIPAFYSPIVNVGYLFIMSSNWALLKKITELGEVREAESESLASTRHINLLANPLSFPSVSFLCVIIISSHNSP